MSSNLSPADWENGGQDNTQNRNASKKRRDLQEPDEEIGAWKLTKGDEVQIRRPSPDEVIEAIEDGIETAINNREPDQDIEEYPPSDPHVDSFMSSLERGLSNDEG